jgi:hypothetical protein
MTFIPLGLNPHNGIQIDVVLGTPAFFYVTAALVVLSAGAWMAQPLG